LVISSLKIAITITGERDGRRDKENERQTGVRNFVELVLFAKMALQHTNLLVTSQIEFLRKIEQGPTHGFTEGFERWGRQWRLGNVRDFTWHQASFGFCSSGFWPSNSNLADRFFKIWRRIRDHVDLTPGFAADLDGYYVETPNRVAERREMIRKWGREGRERQQAQPSSHSPIWQTPTVKDIGSRIRAGVLTQIGVYTSSLTTNQTGDPKCPSTSQYPLAKKMADWS